MNNIEKRQIRRYATDLWACSTDAARWLYGSDKDIFIVKNAINVSDFKFNVSARNKIRNIYNIGYRFTIGMVGRLDYQKNHFFALSVMEQFLRENDGILFIVGTGGLAANIEKKSLEKGIYANVILAGQVNNPADYYSAFDLYFMPSLFEGFPVSLVEASCNGLPSIISDNITPDVSDLPNVYSVSLNEKEKNGQKK